MMRLLRADWPLTISAILGALAVICFLIAGDYLVALAVGGLVGGALCIGIGLRR